MDLISLNGLTPSTTNESLTLWGSSLKMGNISLMIVNWEPFVATHIIPSSLIFVHDNP
jgi:hypothetical protein